MPAISQYVARMINCSAQHARLAALGYINHHNFYYYYQLKWLFFKCHAVSLIFQPMLWWDNNSLYKKNASKNALLLTLNALTGVSITYFWSSTSVICVIYRVSCFSWRIGISLRLVSAVKWLSELAQRPIDKKHTKIKFRLSNVNRLETDYIKRLIFITYRPIYIKRPWKPSSYDWP